LILTYWYMHLSFPPRLLFTALLWIFRTPNCLLAQSPPGAQTTFKFDFGGGPVAAGYTRVLPDPVDHWRWPLSPPAAIIKPDGN
jgi:hypothetical protein